MGCVRDGRWCLQDALSAPGRHLAKVGGFSITASLPWSKPSVTNERQALDILAKNDTPFPLFFSCLAPNSAVHGQLANLARPTPRRKGRTFVMTKRIMRGVWYTNPVKGTILTGKPSTQDAQNVRCWAQGMAIFVVATRATETKPF